MPDFRHGRAEPKTLTAALAGTRQKGCPNAREKARERKRETKEIERGERKRVREREREFCPRKDFCFLTASEDDPEFDCEIEKNIQS